MVVYGRTVYIFGGYIDLKGSSCELWAFCLGTTMSLIIFHKHMYRYLSVLWKYAMLCRNKQLEAPSQLSTWRCVDVSGRASRSQRSRVRQEHVGVWRNGRSECQIRHVALALRQQVLEQGSVQAAGA